MAAMIRHSSVRAIAVAFAAVLGLGLAAGAAETKSAEGWRSLIDPTLSAWRGYKSETVAAGWKVADGVLTKEGKSDDLVTRDQFGDFELEFEWKVAKGGNA